MNHKIIAIGLLLLVIAFGAPVFAQPQLERSEPANINFFPFATLAQAASSDIPIPSNIRNNRYYIESVRLTNLAEAALAEGDYESSTRYSEEAIRYTQLSDEWVRLHQNKRN